MTSNPFAIWAQAEFPYYSDMQDSSSTSTDVTSLSDFSGFPYVHQHTFDQIPVVMVPPASVGDFIDTSSFALGTTSDTFPASSAEQQEDIVGGRWVLRVSRVLRDCFSANTAFTDHMLLRYTFPQAGVAFNRSLSKPKTSVHPMNSSKTRVNVNIGCKRTIPH